LCYLYNTGFVLVVCCSDYPLFVACFDLFV